jgi:hypothetical protein
MFTNEEKTLLARTNYIQKSHIGKTKKQLLKEKNQIGRERKRISKILPVDYFTNKNEG